MKIVYLVALCIASASWALTPEEAEIAQQVANSAKSHGIAPQFNTEEPWAVLGLTENATETEVAASYRLLIRFTHSDLFPDRVFLFKKIQSAYDDYGDKKWGPSIIWTPRKQAPIIATSSSEPDIFEQLERGWTSAKDLGNSGAVPWLHTFALSRPVRLPGHEIVYDYPVSDLVGVLRRITYKTVRTFYNPSLGPYTAIDQHGRLRFFEDARRLARSLAGRPDIHTLSNNEFYEVCVAIATFDNNLAKKLLDTKMGQLSDLKFGAKMVRLRILVDPNSAAEQLRSGAARLGVSEAELVRTMARFDHSGRIYYRETDNWEEWAIIGFLQKNCGAALGSLAEGLRQPN